MMAILTQNPIFLSLFSGTPLVLIFRNQTPWEANYKVEASSQKVYWGVSAIRRYTG
jgi:hypothetical protein